MTVAARSPSIDYIENDVTLTYAVPFRFLPGTLVLSRVIGDAVVPLFLGVNFTSTGGETDTGGAVTLTNHFAGATLRIRRDTTRAQPMSYATGDRFPAKSHELALDRAMLIDQEQDVAAADINARALRVPLGESVAPVPAAAARVGRLLGFGAAGEPIATGVTVAQLTQLVAAVFNPVFTQLAALVSFVQSGFGAVPRSVQDKLQEQISVLDFGARGDGVTDSYPAFAAALAACPAGGTILVPAPPVAYSLSSNPDPVTFSVIGGIGHNTRPKSVNWSIAAGANFTGPGVGLPDVDGIKFLSPITNPFNQTFGQIRQVDLTGQTTLNGGCLIGDTAELTEDFGYAFTVTGDVTNGSSLITNVSANLVGKIKRGDRIESEVAGPRYRVWAVSDDGKTIAFGVDAGAGPAGPTPWGGASQAGLSLTFVKKAWYALEYRGITTGGPNSRDMAYGIRNDVINLTGGPANSYEIDMISLGNTGMFNRCIFFTGHGEAPNTMTPIDIQRAGGTPWSAGVAMRACNVGIFMNAKNPLSIDTEYANPTTGTIERINSGVHFNNSPVIRGALLEGRQVRDGDQAIVIWRNTDLNPSSQGRFLQCMNAANDKELAFVGIQGDAHFTTLQLDQVRTAATVAPNGYITITGADGNLIKLATVA